MKLKDSYGTWQNYVAHFPKSHRYTLGAKIDEIFLSAIEFCFIASYSKEAEKMLFVDKAISRVDLVKLLLQLSWENKCIDTNKYTTLSEQLLTIGKMLGKWKQYIKNKTPATK